MIEMHLISSKMT